MHVWHKGHNAGSTVVLLPFLLIFALHKPPQYSTLLLLVLIIYHSFGRCFAPPGMMSWVECPYNASWGWVPRVWGMGGVHPVQHHVIQLGMRAWRCPAGKHQQVGQKNILLETSGVTLPRFNLNNRFVTWCW